MNPAFRKLQVSVLSQALCRVAPSIRHPVWCTAFANERQYRSMPTHGIGRWRHLLPKQVAKKKRDRLQMTPIVAATPTAYGTLNVTVSGYDMTVVERYSQYIHNACTRLGIDVVESYALPTRTIEVMLTQEQGNKTVIDVVLKSHLRVVQLSSLNATLCPVIMDIVLKNQPEGVQLSVKEHTEADYQARFKVRPELDDLIAQVGPQGFSRSD